MTVAVDPVARGTANPGTGVLELHVDDLRRLFNAMDPSPFRERDLDPAAVEYIVDWAEEEPAGEPLALAVRVDREVPGAADQAMLADAVRAYFSQRAAATRRAVRRLFRDGRISLAIGITFLGVAIGAGELVASLMPKERYATFVQESFVIGGWVALWRPMEIFFYDWWPLSRRARLYDRLAAMGVRVHGASRPAAGATA